MYYLLLSAIVFFIYGTICLISLIFTFSIEAYSFIDEKLKLDVLYNPIVTPLDRNINLIDDWLLENNKVVGPLLIALSIVDMKLFFNIISMVQP